MLVMDLLKAAVAAPGIVLDMISPRTCAGCGAWTCRDERSYLCWDCAAALPLLTTECCVVCGEAPGGAVGQGWLCSACLAKKPCFDSARSAARFAGTVKTMIHAFKYQKGIWLCGDLAGLLEAAYAASPARGAVDAVAYIPLHRLKQRQRTYNQSELLASALARRIGKPLLRGAARRAVATQSQTHLTAAVRTVNVKGVFEVQRPERIRGLRILLVDDVMTTGATVNECAGVMKEAGAAAVHVLTAARG